jgi:phenylalanyl-tRNA synthetase beta chain
VDLEREADLVEEIGRHIGYERVPDRLPPGLPTRPLHPPPAIEEETKDLLAGLGFHEAVCYSMIGAGEDDPFVLPGAPPSLPLANPIADWLGLLRRSLLSGLLRAVDRNLRRGIEDVRLFEVGRVFFPGPPGSPPAEPLRAGFAWSGYADLPHWSGTGRAVDLWDAAGVVEAILRSAGRGAAWAREADPRSGFHPGRSVTWRVGSSPVAWCGELHPELRASLGSPADVYLGEVDLSTLLGLPSPPRAARPVARVPAVRRDLSVVLEPGSAAGSLLERLRAVPAPEPAELEVIDRYAGAPLEAGASAVTVRVMLHPLERTLSDDVIERYRRDLVAAITTGSGFRMRE